MRNLDEYNQRYANKVAFVIGSGTSLNSQDLTPLKDFVTITVNSAYLAFPQADFFISDDDRTAQWSYFLDDLRLGQTTVLLYEDRLSHAAKLFGDRAVIFRHRKGHHLTDIYEHAVYNNRVCEARSSAGSAIQVAHIMGCSKVVLLGIDCCRDNSLRHFWQERGQKKPHRVDHFPTDPYRRCHFESRQSDVDLVDILAYWRDTAHYFLEKCQVFNASPISLLTEFPKVDLQQFIAENQEGKKHV